VGLDKLHALSVELLEVLKENMPYRTGGPEGWNFEKAHSILHKVRDILLFGWSENFSHQGPEHGHIDNCKRLANCTNNKEVYLTVLRAHSREGHLQYLRSLEADLADAAQEEEGDGAEESVAAPAVDKEGEAGACELGIRYPTLQSIYAGKLNKQSIQVYIIYDIMFCIMISYLISCMIYRCREEKRMLELQTAMLTITMLARSAWMCIFSSQPVWMSFQSRQMSFVQMTASWRGNCGSSIRIANSILSSAGCLQNLPHGLVRIMDRSCRYLPSGTWSGQQGS
jgi:hypothetical protein